MNEPNVKSKPNGYAIAAATFFAVAVWLAYLGFYIRTSIVNYKPQANEVQEGDMVSALAMTLMFGAAALSLIAAVCSLLVFLLRRFW